MVSEERPEAVQELLKQALPTLCNKEINGEVPPHYLTNPIFQRVLITFLGSCNLEIFTLQIFM